MIYPEKKVLLQKATALIPKNLDRPSLFSSGSGNRASLCASATLNALVCIDLIFAIALFDSTYRASLCACATSDALIRNLVCHSEIPPYNFDYIYILAQ